MLKGILDFLANPVWMEFQAHKVYPVSQAKLVLLGLITTADFCSSDTVKQLTPLNALRDKLGCGTATHCCTSKEMRSLTIKIWVRL